MDKISAIARKYKLNIVEDCAQAAGSLFGINKTGTIGDCGSFSFYPTKNFGAYGDGGAITTNNNLLYEKILMIRNYGLSSRYQHDYDGLNSRLDEVQAAVLATKLKFLDSWNQKRRKIAKKGKDKYFRYFDNKIIADFIINKILGTKITKKIKWMVELKY